MDNHFPYHFDRYREALGKILENCVFEKSFQIFFFRLNENIQNEDFRAELEKLRKEFDRLQQVGIDKLVPSEGIVFIYKGNTYKLTGAFAPVNQITGMMAF